MALKHLPDIKVSLQYESKTELAQEVVCCFQTYLGQWTMGLKKNWLKNVLWNTSEDTTSEVCVQETLQELQVSNCWVIEMGQSRFRQTSEPGQSSRTQWSKDRDGVSRAMLAAVSLAPIPVESSLSSVSEGQCLYTGSSQIFIQKHSFFKVTFLLFLSTSSLCSMVPLWFFC